MFHVLTKDKPVEGVALDPQGSLMHMNLEGARYIKEAARDIPVVVMLKR